MRRRLHVGRLTRLPPRRPPRSGRWRLAAPSLRARFVLYLVLLHVVFAAAAVVFLRQHRPWLLAVEALFVVSAGVALYLVRKLGEPARLLRSGTQLLEDGDFATRFRATGVAELDALTHIYNRMADELRQERIRSQEHESFLGRVLAATPSGVLTFDFESRITMANPGAAALLGGAPADLVGRTLTELGSPFATALAALAPGTAVVLPLRGRRRVKCQRGEFFDRGFPRPFVFMEELTEELRRSEKAAYDKLIRMMSHEVNNTSGAVDSLLQSCQRYGGQLAAPDQSEFETALDVARRRIAHMNLFMRSFADVVRIPPPRLEPCDLQTLLANIVGVLRGEAAERRIRIDTAWVEPSPVVACDAPQLEQAVVNVFRNGMEAIGSDGTIVLRTGVERQGVAFLVIEDSGPGFTAEVARQLFTPFFTTKQNGSGIGLMVVREILEAHGFEYALESTPGAPTRFTIHFQRLPGRTPV